MTPESVHEFHTNRFDDGCQELRAQVIDAQLESILSAWAKGLREDAVALASYRSRTRMPYFFKKALAWLKQAHEQRLVCKIGSDKNYGPHLVTYTRCCSRAKRSWLPVTLRLLQMVHISLALRMATIISCNFFNLVSTVALLIRKRASTCCSHLKILACRTGSIARRLSNRLGPSDI